MGHGLIDEVKKKFWDRFEGLPSSKHEAFRYLPLSKLAPPLQPPAERKASLAELEPHLLPDSSGRIVFSDGYFSPELSSLPKGCILLSLGDAMKSFGLVLQNRFAKALKEETDPLATLNGAFQGRGAFVYLPPGLVLEQPIQMISLFSSAQWMAERVQLFLGKGAEAKLIQTFAGSGTAVELIDIVLEERARLSIQDRSHLQNEAVFFRNLRASLKKNAHLDSFSFSEGSALYRRSLSATLLEEGAEVHLKGLDNLTASHQAHTHVHVEHAAPHCLSRQHFKKALQETARSSFEGKIYVHPVAQKTEAYQLNQNLILSADAAAHSKPNLEIFADDVKASHGATFSQLSPEELFYFQARGIPASEAKQLLFRGFCSELIDDLSFAPFREALQARLR